MLSPEDCTSLIEAFTEEQILNHVKSLDTGMHLSQERIQVGVVGQIRALSSALLELCNVFTCGACIICSRSTIPLWILSAFPGLEGWGLTLSAANAFTDRLFLLLL